MAALATPAFLNWALGPNGLTRPCPREGLKGAHDKTITETELVSRMLKGSRVESSGLNSTWAGNCRQEFCLCIEGRNRFQDARPSGTVTARLP